MRLACWFRGLAETIFSLNSFRSDKYRSIGKVRDREDALASTRDAYATPRNPPLIPFCPPCREYAKIFRRLAHPGGGCSGCTLAGAVFALANSPNERPAQKKGAQVFSRTVRVAAA